MLKEDNPNEDLKNVNKKSDEKASEASQNTDNVAEDTSNNHQNEIKIDFKLDEKSEPKSDTESSNGDASSNGKHEGPTDENTQTDPKELKIIELEAKFNEINDKYLRLFSEFDNFRKRSIKERVEITKTASAEMTEAILPVLDDLERAFKSATENPDIDILIEGINLILAKLKTTLKQKGLEEIKAIGETFDTDFHEAITHMPATDDKQKGKVVDEIQKGYLLNGKIIRFAKVIVAN